MKSKKTTVKWPLGSVVEVFWEDANSYNKWHDLKELSRDHHVASCKTIGYLLKSDKREILLVSTQTPENDADGTGTMAIPRGCVTHIKVIRKA